MKYLKFIILSFLVIVSIITNTFSQSVFNIHAGPSIPIGHQGLYEIHYSDYQLNSTPSVGINLGFEYSYEFAINGLSLFAGLDFFYNIPNKEYRDSIRQIWKHSGIEVTKFHSEYNIPLSTGLEYRLLLNEKTSIFCNSGITINFHKTSNFVTDYSTTVFDWATRFGFKISGGFILKSKFKVQLSYWRLGKHEINFRDIERTYLSGSKEINIQFLTITFGVNF